MGLHYDQLLLPLHLFKIKHFQTVTLDQFIVSLMNKSTNNQKNLTGRIKKKIKSLCLRCRNIVIVQKQMHGETLK